MNQKPQNSDGQSNWLQSTDSNRPPLPENVHAGPLQTPPPDYYPSNPSGPDMPNSPTYNSFTIPSSGFIPNTTSPSTPARENAPGYSPLPSPANLTLGPDDPTYISGNSYREPGNRAYGKAPFPPLPASDLTNPQTTPAYPPVSTSNRSVKSRHKGAMLLIVIALLVILGSSILGILQYRNNQTIAQANSNAHLESTSMAQANAYATRAAASATSVASAYPFFPDLVLDDPLVDNTHTAYDWETNNRCSFTGSAYRIVGTQLNAAMVCIGATTNFSNFTFQADMTLRQGDAQQANGGLYFRGNAQHGYLFTINQQDSYTLWITTDATADNARIVRSGQASQFIPGFSQKNTLSVVAHNDQISLYVNQQLIAAIQDSTYAGGEIGFIAGVGPTAPTATIMDFDNAKVWA